MAICGATIIIGFCCILTYVRSRITNMWDEGNTQLFFNTFIFIPAGSMYFCIKYWVEKHSFSAKLSKLIHTLGICTFGVYVFETIYREETKAVFWKLLPHFPTIIACVMWIFCAFLVGVGVTLILKHLPIARKLI